MSLKGVKRNLNYRLRPREGESLWTFSCVVLFGSRLVLLWFPLRFPLVVQLPLDFLSVQGGHTGKMPVVALACVVLQQDKVLISPARTGRFAEVPDVNWQVWSMEKPRTTGYMVAT